jgi:hypothetical protein
MPTFHSQVAARRTLLEGCANRALVNPGWARRRQQAPLWLGQKLFTPSLPLSTCTWFNPFAKRRPSHLSPDFFSVRADCEEAAVIRGWNKENTQVGRLHRDVQLRVQFAPRIPISIQTTAWHSVSKPKNPGMRYKMRMYSRGFEFGLHLNPILPASSCRARGFSSEHLVFGVVAEANRSRGRGWATLPGAFHNMFRSESLTWVVQMRASRCGWEC